MTHHYIQHISQVPPVKPGNAKVLADWKLGKGLALKEILMLCTGSRICDAIKDKPKAAFFISALNSELERAGVSKNVGEQDQVKELMSLMLPARDLSMLGADQRNHAAFNQILAYAPQNKTFEAANGSGSCHVYEDNGEKYKIELPSVFTKRGAGMLTDTSGMAYSPNYGQGIALSITLDSIKELRINAAGNEVVMVPDISKWFAMKLPAKIMVAPNSPRARAQVMTQPLKIGVQDMGTMI